MDGMTLEHIIDDVWFAQAEHRYFHVLPSGLRGIPSVSAILQAAGMIKSHPSPKGRQFYLDRGRLVHRACFLDDTKEGLDDRSIDPGIIGYVRAYRSFKAKHRPVVLEHEQGVYDEEHDVCGTFDLLVTLPLSSMPKREDIIDLKHGVPDDFHAVQCAGYDIARFGPRWLAHGTGSLYLHGDGTFKLVQYRINQQMKAGTDYVRAVLDFNRNRYDLFGEEERYA